MDHLDVAGLFENIGVIQDGIETIARDRSIKDIPDAKPLTVKEVPSASRM